MRIEQARRIFGAPFGWGVADCCTAPSDLFRLLHGVDPMALLRGRYDSLSGALRLARSFGGFEAMAQACADHAGLRGGVGAVGEIGLVDAMCLPFVAPHMTRAMALRMRDGWWVRMENGVIVVSDVTRCWRA